MANYTRDQIELEIQYSRLILKNVIIYNKNEAMVNNARAILADPKLLERFVFNRLNKKYGNKESTSEKPKSFSLSSLMFWKR